MKLPEGIKVDPEIMMGKPCVKGTRIPVYVLLQKMAAGETGSASDKNCAWHFCGNYRGTPLIAPLKGEKFPRPASVKDARRARRLRSLTARAPRGLKKGLCA